CRRRARAARRRRLPRVPGAAHPGAAARARAAPEPVLPALGGAPPRGRRRPEGDRAPPARQAPRDRPRGGALPGPPPDDRGPPPLAPTARAHPREAPPRGARLPHRHAPRDRGRATQATLQEWTERLRAEAGDGFPEKVTAFRDGMAVHGRYRKPCPDCGSPVQRIVYAENETNYCARCQTGGVLLADRSLSRLFKD